MKRGSLTPFCALVLMIITSLLLVLLEYSRVHGLERYAQMKADTAADSLCAEFQPYLWQEYGILFLNGAYGTETFSEVFIAESLENHLKENCAKSKNMGFDLFELKPKEVLLEGYALATDREGEVFLNYIAQRQMENLPLGMAEDLYQKYQQVERLDVHNSKIEEVIQQAQSTLTEVKTSYLNLKERSSIEDTSALDSILENAAQMHTSKLLNKIFGEEYSISLKSSELSSKLRSRKKEEGTLGQNIHKLLRENFFMEYTIGEYAKELIENVMLCLQENVKEPEEDGKFIEMHRTVENDQIAATQEIDVNKILGIYFDEIPDRYKALQMLIEQISEPIYRHSLMKMLHKSRFAKERDIEHRIMALEEEKRKLQEQIDILKEKQ